MIFFVSDTKTKVVLAMQIISVMCAVTACVLFPVYLLCCGDSCGIAAGNLGVCIAGSKILLTIPFSLFPG